MMWLSLGLTVFLLYPILISWSKFLAYCLRHESSSRCGLDQLAPDTFREPSRSLRSGLLSGCRILPVLRFQGRCSCVRALPWLGFDASLAQASDWLPGPIHFTAAACAARPHPRLNRLRREREWFHHVRHWRVCHVRFSRLERLARASEALVIILAHVVDHISHRHFRVACINRCGLAAALPYGKNAKSAIRA